MLHRFEHELIEMGLSECRAHTIAQDVYRREVRSAMNYYYELHQIKPVYLHKAFLYYDHYLSHFGTLSLDDYDQVYRDFIEASSPDEAKAKLFRQFNIDHPDDFTGRSMSISDILYLDERYWYCDFIDFQDVTNQVMI